ncbi:hypothetical protein JZ751_018545 [Albula glossodonta]|uniref:Homeobox domain-containing protein n=1 Tax=Albula glossodonta TaxID=121402 RepID=A0A8T2NLZ6_9TELE|nr:hypothetical protein JZ751_018545 [Albula glossodonta]
MECIYPTSSNINMCMPRYAQTPVQNVHPTPFNIEDILYRNSRSSDHMMFTDSSITFVPPNTTPIYKPTSIHPVFWRHKGLTPHATVFVNPLRRALGCYAHSVDGHDLFGQPFLWAPLIQRPQHKRKGGQIRFSSDQTVRLEQKFQTQKYLSLPERKRLAKTLQLSERQSDSSHLCYLLRAIQPKPVLLKNLDIYAFDRKMREFGASVVRLDPHEDPGRLEEANAKPAHR